MVTPESDGSPTGARARLLVAAAVLVAFGVMVLGWMAASFDDWVPLDPPATLPAGVDRSTLPPSAHFRCAGVLGEDGSAKATEQAIEALAIQQLSREPCVGARRQHRLLGIVDLALAGAGLLVVGWASLRARHRERDDTTGGTTGGTPANGDVVEAVDVVGADPGVVP
jgi:hypothetical protein